MKQQKITLPSALLFLLAGSFVLHLEIDPQTLSQAEEQGVAVGELEDGDIVSYVRVGDSAIVYQLTPDVCRSLLEASCDNFRHRQVLWADWEDVTQLDILLEGEQYTISSQGSGEDRTYLYDGQELDTAALQDALAALRARGYHIKVRSKEGLRGLALELEEV